MFTFGRQIQSGLLGGLLLAIVFSPQLVPSDETTGKTQAQGSVDEAQVSAKPTNLGKAKLLLERFGPLGKETEPLPGSLTTLQFEKGQLSGTAVCNNRFGGYQAIGDPLTVEILCSNVMRCEVLIDRERSSLNLLGRVATAARQGELLQAVRFGR